jgi:hypothetical protein
MFGQTQGIMTCKMVVSVGILKGIRIMKNLLAILVSLTAVAVVSSIALAADNNKKRFELKFHTDGTQTAIDNDTGLEWEIKTGVPGTTVFCPGAASCTDPTNVSNSYSWSDFLHEHPDGSLYTDFLARMNCVKSTNHICGPGSHTDWRIPTVAELKTIVDCTFSPCLNPIFGPTQEVSEAFGGYWTGTTVAGNTDSAFTAEFSTGNVSQNVKPGSRYVRAVRGGR